MRTRSQDFCDFSDFKMFQMWPHKQKHVAPTVQKLWKFISERLLGKRVTNIYASKYYGKHIYSRHSLNLRLFGLLLVQQLRITDSFGQALCKKIPGKEEERGGGGVGTFCSPICLDTLPCPAQCLDPQLPPPCQLCAEIVLGSHLLGRGC